jgi:hypothetical protein
MIGTPIARCRYTLFLKRWMPLWSVRSRLVNLALICICCLAAVIIVYRMAPITFFRAETGHWLLVAHTSSEAQNQMVREFWTTSSHGHYTPLAFTAEFFFTKWADTGSWLWRIRQQGAVALVAAVFFIVVRSIALMLRFSRRTATCIAAGLTAAFIYQPLVNELVGWPFHIFQIAWLFFMLVTIAALIQLLRNPGECKWVWVLAGSSYASMHALGLGFVTWVGTILAMSILLISTYGKIDIFRAQRRTLLQALILLSAVGAAHALCMYLFMGPPRPAPSAPVPFGWSHALGLLAVYPLAIPLNFFGIVPSSYGDIAIIIESAWPYGVLVLAATGAGLWLLAQSVFRQGNPNSLAPLVIYSFSFVAGIAFFGMIAMRELHEIGGLNSEFTEFFISPRYVIPFSCTILASVLLLLLSVMYRRQRFAAAVAIALGIASLFAHIHYTCVVSPRVLANNSIPHAKAWKLIVAMAQECRAVGLPIPNMSMYQLETHPHEPDLRYFEPVLRDSLHLTREEHCRFVDWAQSRGAERAKYDAASPSLHRVIKLLRIQDPAPHS